MLLLYVHSRQHESETDVKLNWSRRLYNYGCPGWILIVVSCFSVYTWATFGLHSTLPMDAERMLKNSIKKKERKKASLATTKSIGNALINPVVDESFQTRIQTVTPADVTQASPHNHNRSVRRRLCKIEFGYYHTLLIPAVDSQRQVAASTKSRSLLSWSLARRFVVRQLYFFSCRHDRLFGFMPLDILLLQLFVHRPLVGVPCSAWRDRLLYTGSNKQKNNTPAIHGETDTHTQAATTNKQKTNKNAIHGETDISGSQNLNNTPSGLGLARQWWCHTDLVPCRPCHVILVPYRPCHVDLV